MRRKNRAQTSEPSVSLNKERGDATVQTDDRESANEQRRRLYRDFIQREPLSPRFCWALMIMTKPIFLRF